MPGLADCQRTEERGLRTEKSLGKRIVVTNLFSVALGHWNDSNPIARTTKIRIQIHWKHATAMGRPSDQHYAGRPQACQRCGEPWTISGERGLERGASRASAGKPAATEQSYKLCGTELGKTLFPRKRQRYCDEIDDDAQLPLSVSAY